MPLTLSRNKSSCGLGPNKHREKACQLKVAGIIAPNHGGRQLDTTEATIRVLPEIAQVIANRIPLLLDSGIRRGMDIFKAIALGADAILIGRCI